MTSDKQALLLQEYQELINELYDTEYYFDSNDITDILTLARPIAPVETLRNLTVRAVKEFTIPIPKDMLHYNAAFLFGIPVSGKTIFIFQLIYRMWQYYGDDLNPIITYEDMTEGTRYFDDRKVQLLIVDDSLTHHSKAQKKKKSGELLAKIRHVYDKYDDSITGIVYVIFASQSVFDLDISVRRQLNCRVYKSLSGLNWDNDNAIRPDVGLYAYKVLSYIHQGITKANNDVKSTSIVSFIGGDRKDNVGYIYFPYNEKEIEKAKEISTIIFPSMSTKTDFNVELSLTNYTKEKTFNDLPVILLDELRKNRELLAEAEKDIGKTVLERNVKMWFLRQFHGWSYEDRKSVV